MSIFRELLSNFRKLSPSSFVAWELSSMMTNVSLDFRELSFVLAEASPGLSELSSIVWRLLLNFRERSSILVISLYREMKVPVRPHPDEQWTKTLDSTEMLCWSLCQFLSIVIFLAIHYTSDVMFALDPVRHIIRDVNYGWILRIFHANGLHLLLHTMRLQSLTT